MGGDCCRLIPAVPGARVELQAPLSGCSSVPSLLLADCDGRVVLAMCPSPPHTPRGRKPPESCSQPRLTELLLQRSCQKPASNRLPESVRCRALLGAWGAGNTFFTQHQDGEGAFFHPPQKKRNRRCPSVCPHCHGDAGDAGAQQRCCAGSREGRGKVFTPSAKGASSPSHHMGWVGNFGLGWAL